jgi:hypothetical protein
MKLIPKIPLALLLLGTTLRVCAQNNPPVQCECCTDVCYVVQAPPGSYTYTNVNISPGTNVCLGSSISAAPLGYRTYTTQITRGHWEVHTADCLPDSWFTNLSQTFWTTNWWVVSSPGYSASGPYNGGWISFQPTNCGSGTITFYGTFKDVAPCTTQPTYGGGTTSISTNFYVGNVQIFESWKAVCTNGSTSFTLSNTCDTVTWEVSPVVLGGPYASGSTIYAGTNCGTYTVTARSTVNTNCTGSTTLYVVEFDSISADATYVSTNNWAAVKTTNATDYVTLTANLCPFVTNAAVLLTWSGGQVVPGNPLQRRVPKNVAAKTVVTATCCGNSTNVNVWIVWVNFTEFNNTGPADSDSAVSPLDDGVAFGAVNDTPGGDERNGMLLQATISPSGFGRLGVPFTFTRIYELQAWAERSPGNWVLAVKNPSYPNADPDGPSSGSMALVPTSTDHIYNEDGPGPSQMNDFGGAASWQYTFSEWASVSLSGGTQCSDIYLWHSVSSGEYAANAWHRVTSQTNEISPGSWTFTTPNW